MDFKTKDLRVFNIADVHTEDIEICETFEKSQISQNHMLIYSSDAKMMYDFNGQILQMIPNSILYIPQNTEYEVAPLKGGSIICISFDIVESSEQKPFLLSCSSIRKAGMLFRNAESDFEHKNLIYKQLADVYEILSMMSNETQSEYFTKTDEEKIKTAIAFIEQNYSNPDLSASRIAKSVDLSVAVLRNKFLKVCGVSPMQYLMTTRMTAAKKLLRETQIPILQVSLLVGYEDSFYFSKIFHKKCAMTPSDYRRKYMTEDDA